MNQQSLCRLCLNSCREYKGLYDDSGGCNEIYETTVKYFDPMILSLERVQQPVICLNCWRHIDDFNHFQLSVLLAQDTFISKDYNLKSNDEMTIKIEDEIPIDAALHLQLSISEVEDPCGSTNILNDSTEIDDEDIKKNIFSSDNELFDPPENDQFSSDDEKPLVERVEVKKKRGRPKKNKVLDETSHPKKRGRKPKNEDESQATTKNSNKSYQSNSDNNSECENSKLEDKKAEDNLKTGEQDRSERTSKEIDDFIASWKEDLDCYICGETSKTMHLLRQHFRKEHPNTRCYVLCCQRKLSRRHQLEDHIRLHVDPAAFKCNLCGKCCTNKRTLSNHMYEQHTEAGQYRSYECPICHKRFAKNAVMKRHVEIHETNKDFVCKECGKGFPTEQRRNVHERMVHNSDHVCDQCGKTIRGKYALRQHVLEHAGVQKRKWSCDQCNAQLNTHASLRRHKEVAHHDGTTAYICSECGKVSATAFGLRSHKKYVHQAKRKYACTLCDKAFKTNIGMREHMATHTGEDLYTCPHCPRTFKVNANMHHHRKKAHPKEWLEARMGRGAIMPTFDVNQVTQEVVI